MSNSETIKEKLKAKVSNRKPKWLEDVLFAKENEAWLDKSAQIAIKILRHLRLNKISQVELANRLGVSAQYVNKIVKGRENLSLETICKLENALNISLVKIVSYESSLEESFNVIPIRKPVSRNKAKSLYSGSDAYVNYSHSMFSNCEEMIA